MRTIFCFFVFPFLLEVEAHAQAADDIVKKYVEFIGGKKAWKSIKTITSSGEYDYGGMVFPFNAYSKAPNRYKFIVPFNGKYYAQAFDGVKGWKIDAFKNETKTTPLEGKAALALANEADVELEDPFIDYKAKGHKVVSEGKDTVQGVICNKIRLVRKNGETETYYFNETSAALVMKTAVSKNVELGGSMLNITYSDYRKVEGIQLPFKTVCESNGQMILTITVATAALNLPVEDKEFQP